MQLKTSNSMENKYELGNNSNEKDPGVSINHKLSLKQEWDTITIRSLRNHRLHNNNN